MGCLGDDPPDPAKGYVGGINADLESLPARRIIEAADTYTGVANLSINVRAIVGIISIKRYGI